MKIADIFPSRLSFSFEVFPPKTDQPVEPLMQTLDRLYAYRPDYISCTYGAGGTNKGRNAEIVAAIHASGKSTALTHFTCIGNTRADIDETLCQYLRLGVTSVLALRGDMPKGQTQTCGDFAHADALIAYIKARHPGMEVAAAAYPEKHVQALSIDADIEHLKRKQDNGAAFCITQLCHSAEAIERFLSRIRRAGVTLPVIVGVLPVLNKDSLIRMTLANGCSIPAPLAEIIGRYGESPEDFKKAGKEFTARLLTELPGCGINGLHLYTMNKYSDISDIIELSGVRERI